MGAYYPTSTYMTTKEFESRKYEFARAQRRTRTGDPFLTMEVLYQLS